MAVVFVLSLFSQVIRRVDEEGPVVFAPGGRSSRSEYLQRKGTAVMRLHQRRRKNESGGDIFCYVG